MTSAGRHEVPAQIARWSSDLAESGLDRRLDAVFRRRLIDYVANLVGGARARPAVLLDAYAERFPGPVPAPGGRRAAAETAALLYGAAAHALEFDDTHQPSSTHPGAVIFSAALPLAVELDATLDDVARAVVAGYEVMCRLGEDASPTDQYARGFHPTGTCGVFGAAVSAGILLRLTRPQLAAALGLVASFSSGSMAFLEGGGWSKLLNAGHAAAAGITAAHLAALGYEAPRESIAGPHGFLAGHSSAERLAASTHADEATAIERTSVKAHGCCRYEQGPIDAILQLRRAHGFDAEDVESVDVAMLEAGWSIVAEPLAAKRRPANVVESQFSMPFGAALAVVLGHATPLDHSVQRLMDPRIQRVMDVVECHRDPALDAEYPERWPAHVRIALRNGTMLEERVDFPRGDPENPLSDEELLDKLRALAPDVAESAVDAFAELVLERDLPAIRSSTLTTELSSLWSTTRERPRVPISKGR